jgi:hypothetical protein
LYSMVSVYVLVKIYLLQCKLRQCSSKKNVKAGGFAKTNVEMDKSKVEAVIFFTIC